MKVRSAAVGLFMFMSLFFGLDRAAYSAEMVDKVIVVVNDEVVTQREFDRIFSQVEKMLEANLKGEELQNKMEDAKKNILEQLINSKLAISLAKKAKVEIDEAELKKRIDTIKSYYPNEDEFLKALSDKGTTMTEFEREMRDQMLAQKLVENEVASKITITPGDMKDLYDKNKDKMVSRLTVKLRSITINKEPGKEADSKAKTQEILKKAKGGEDFTELAKTYSMDGYAAQGGDIGYLSPGETLTEIDDVVFKLKPGEVSDIVETQIGYHIFKVEEIKEPRQLGFDEVSDFLRQQLHMKRFEEDLVKWLEAKRKNAYISYK